MVSRVHLGRDTPPGVGRIVNQIDLPTQSFDPTPIPLTCDQVAESEESWAARRAGTLSQIFANDVEMITVPEPGPAWLQATTLLVALALSRSRRAN